MTILKIQLEKYPHSGKIRVLRKTGLSAAHASQLNGWQSLGLTLIIWHKYGLFLNYGNFISTLYFQCKPV
jgi:hypothetical protein